jgi:hypothetical protein
MNQATARGGRQPTGWALPRAVENRGNPIETAMLSEWICGKNRQSPATGILLGGDLRVVRGGGEGH